MNDPFNQNQNPFQSPQKRAQKSPTNFIEALKSIGGQTAKSISHDVMGGVSRDFVQSFTGGQSPSEANRRNEQMMDPEAQIREEIMRRKRHREVTETRLFDRKEEEVKVKIKVIQDELKLLASELAGLDVQLEKAISQEITNPGTYHVNFFEKLRRMLLDLRKRVMDSSSWLETAGARRQAQQGYWGNVGKSGTKYMLSSERTLATQSG